MWEYAAILFILGIVGYLIFQPLVKAKQLEALAPQERDMREKALRKRKEDVYGAIKEMDFDFGMGKISQEDYQELRSQYKSKALEILKELDGVASEEDPNAVIEREVRALRKKKEAKKEKPVIAKGAARQINFCPNCGMKVTPDGNFCQGCGMKLILPGGRD